MDSLELVERVFRKMRILILLILEERGCCSFTELRDILKTYRGVVAQKVKELEMLGLVETSFELNKQSKPFKKICLTKKGKEVVKLLKRLIEVLSYEECEEQESQT